MQLPSAFEEQIDQLLGDKKEAFIQALSTEAPISVRFNPFKPISQAIHLAPIPWHEDGFYLKKRPLFTLDPLFHAGGYYVQEASSMLIAEAIRQHVDLNQPLKVLDLAAAPGGKTTLLSSLINSDSLLIANEVIKSRYKILQQNVAKWGVPNTFTTNLEVVDLSPLKECFDVILVDAPCSGEGMFRKNPDSIKEWSLEHVRLCAARQKKILSNTIDLLKPGGVLLYSTCTYNKAENDYNSQWLSETFPLTFLPLALPEEWNIEARLAGYQLYPHKVNGEGFYLTTFRKTGVIEEDTKKKKRDRKAKAYHSKLSRKERGRLAEWLHPDLPLSVLNDPKGQLYVINAAHEDLALHLSNQLKQIQLGTPIGTFKHEQFVPAHELALSTAKNPALPATSVDLEAALQFLKKNPIHWTNMSKGWGLVRYQGLDLGWIKGLGNRINNYFPNNWRILMDIPEKIQSFWSSPTGI